MKQYQKVISLIIGMNNHKTDELQQNSVKKKQGKDLHKIPHGVIFLNSENCAIKLVLFKVNRCILSTDSMSYAVSNSKSNESCTLLKTQSNKIGFSRSPLPLLLASFYTLSSLPPKQQLINELKGIKSPTFELQLLVSLHKNSIFITNIHNANMLYFKTSI